MERKDKKKEYQLTSCLLHPHTYHCPMYPLIYNHPPHIILPCSHQIHGLATLGNDTVTRYWVTKVQPDREAEQVAGPERNLDFLLNRLTEDTVFG